MALNVVMMATGTFALPGFEALVESDHYVAALITQPDRLNPRGKPHPHPLKEFAEANGIPVMQPQSINTPESIRKLQALRPDVVLVAAYGQILKPEVINVPRLGMYNLHGSLLPRHRGAAPVQYAVWKGDRKSGVTIFRIEPKLDAGPMIVRMETEILPRETSGELHDRLAVIGADALLETVRLLEAGEAKPLVQDETEVTQSPKIRKEQGLIDWTQSPAELDCHIRAMQPWPNPFTFLHRPDGSSERMLILQITSDHSLEAKGKPGEILSGQGSRMLVNTGNGVVEVDRLQPAGKKAMATADYLRGRPLTGGEYFSPEE